MEVEIKHYTYKFIADIPIQRVNILWCSDSWTYIPELRIRRRFFIDNKVTKMEQETWEGTIPIPEYSEEIDLYQFSETKWREVSSYSDELFSVKTANQNIHS